MVVDVGLQPRLVGGPGAGAVGEVGAQGVPDGRLHLVLDRAGQLLVLLLVDVAVAVARAGGLVHRVRDRVGHHDHRHLLGRVVGQESAHRIGHQAGVRRREARVVGVGAHLVDADRRAARIVVVDDGLRQVLPVLAAAGVARVGTRGQGEHPPVPRRGGPGDGVGQEGLAVAIAPQHRQLDAAPRQLRLQGGLERPVLVVDGTASAEVGVVGPHLHQALVGDPAPGGHAAQEGQHLIGPLGATEGGEQDGVVRGQGGVSHLDSPMRRAWGACQSNTIAAMRIPKTSPMMGQTVSGPMRYRWWAATVREAPTRAGKA